MISKLTALAGDTQLDGLIKRGGIHFSAGNGMHVSQTVYVFPKKQADPRKDVDYPWVGESFSLKGKAYSVIYLNDPSNPRNALFPDYGDSARVGYFYKATVAKGQRLTLHVRFLISEGAMPSADLIQKADNDFAGCSDPVPEVTLLKGLRINPPAATPPTSTAPAPQTSTTNTAQP
jgi:hypothetical protein